MIVEIWNFQVLNDRQMNNVWFIYLKEYYDTFKNDRYKFYGDMENIYERMFSEKIIN